MKRLLLLLVFTSQLSVAQDFTAQWEAFFSYTSLVDVVENDTRIYAAAQNSIFIYDTITEQVETLTTVNGLSANVISEIHYSDQHDLLVVGFENGLLQLVSNDGNVRTVVAIRDKIVIPPNNKRINEFVENGDLLYIASDFGIALYNLALFEFDDTYFIGDAGAQLVVNSIAIHNNIIYAATDNGIRLADISNPFLLDFMNWSTVNPGVWHNMTLFNNRVYAVSQSRNIARSNTLGAFTSQPSSLPFMVEDAYVNNNRIIYATSSAVVVYDVNFNQQFILDNVNGQTFSYTSALLLGDIVYAATTQSGLIQYNISIPNSQEFIVADGPARNDIFSVQALPSQLWITYGAHTIFYTPDDALHGISHLVDDSWINYTSGDVLGLRSIPKVVINPEDETQLKVLSMNNGMIDFNNGASGTAYGINNSSLVSILPPSDFFVRTPDGAYDSQGNFWVIQSQVDQALHRQSPSGQWTPFDVGTIYNDVPSSSSTTKMVITSNDRILFGTTDAGLVGYNPSNNSYSRITTGIQQGNLVNNYIASLRIDQRGQLWIGSNLGLRVLFSANSLFSDNPPDARPIIIEDDNGIPRELLADEAVLDIEVDGNNNKWVATGSSGVFLFSPSGQETLLQFTKENSPLPDNEVRDISIDETTGLIYFATKNGLVAYRGTRSSKPQDDLENVYAFPNPVRPGYDGPVTIDGLTSRARVKITDIEGNLVYEEISQGGSIQWDTTSFSGDKVRSGVYMLLISTQDNIETTVSKIMIVR